jgi:hypothetical protein
MQSSSLEASAALRKNPLWVVPPELLESKCEPNLALW